MSARLVIYGWVTQLLKLGHGGPLDCQWNMFVFIRIWRNSLILAQPPSWSCFTQFSKVARLKLKPKPSEFIEWGGYKIEKDWLLTTVPDLFLPHDCLIATLEHDSIPDISLVRGSNGYNITQRTEAWFYVWFVFYTGYFKHFVCCHIWQNRQSIPGITFQIASIYINIAIF